MRQQHESKLIFRPSRRQAWVLALAFLLTASLGLSLYRLVNLADETKAAQIVGGDIAAGLYISNKAPSLSGEWQSSDPALNPILNGGPGRSVQARNSAVELKGYQLWRKRGDDDLLANYYNRHYKNKCYGIIDYRTDAFGNRQPINGDYDCDDPTGEGNANPLSDNLNGMTLLSKDDVMKTWSPYLVVGGYHPSHTGTQSGFEDKTLLLDAWLLAGTQSLTLTAKDLCADDYTEDFYGGNGQTILSLITGNGTEELIDCSQNQSGCASLCSVTVDLTSLKPFGGPRLLYADSTAEPVMYEFYRLKAEATPTSQSSLYANQFQLEITNPANTSYLTAAKTRETSSGGSIDQSNAFPIAMRLPGDTSSTPGNPNYQDLEILWQTEIYVAPDPDLGCSYDNQSNVGMYDTDYPNGAQEWMKPHQRNFPPKMEIAWTWRDVLGTPGWQTASWQVQLTLTFGQQTASNNVWENIPVRFEGDKIYRFRISNIDQRTWIQVKLPFDQMSALQRCYFKPLVKVYYSDISAGGRFGLGETSEACLDQADIDNHRETYAGLYAHEIGQWPQIIDSSSAEYGVRVRDDIRSFASGFKPNRIPPSANQLTFANSFSGRLYGGYFGKSRCIPNYWRASADQPFDRAAGTGQDIQNMSAGVFSYKPSVGSSYVALRNSRPADDLGLRLTIYIDGDLLIEDNILNNTSGSSHTGFLDLGYIMIIVKGDILIRQGVSWIDAVLVAYPNPGLDKQIIQDDTKGRIYTCYPSTVRIDGTQLSLDSVFEAGNLILLRESREYNQACSANKLIINGALIARELHLGRTYVDRVNPVIDSDVSEEINLLPEYFIGVPFLPGFEDWLHRSDSIEILPVNF